MYATWEYDEDLITATGDDGQSRVRTRPWQGVCIVLGRGSSSERELDLEACVADQVPILRRRGGGCAVVLDPGNVIVSATMRTVGLQDIPALHRSLSDWVRHGLCRLGFSDLGRDGVSDLVRGDRKLGGTTMYRARDLVYFSASLLVAPDISLMTRYLRHPPREPAYRGNRPHAQFVTDLQTIAGRPLEPAQLAIDLQGALGPPPGHEG